MGGLFLFLEGAKEEEQRLLFEMKDPHRAKTQSYEFAQYKHRSCRLDPHSGIP